MYKSIIRNKYFANNNYVVPENRLGEIVTIRSRRPLAASADLGPTKKL